MTLMYSLFNSDHSETKWSLLIEFNKHLSALRGELFNSVSIIYSPSLAFSLALYSSHNSVDTQMVEINLQKEKLN